VSAKENHVIRTIKDLIGRRAELLLEKEKLSKTILAIDGVIKILEDLDKQ